jgi:hypothetical protein
MRTADPEEDRYVRLHEALLQQAPQQRKRAGINKRLSRVALGLLLTAVVLLPAVLLCVGGNVLKAPSAVRRLCLGMWAVLALVLLTAAAL